MQSLSSKKTSRFVLCAVLCALSLGLSLIDTAISIPFLPGIKLGLASIVSLYALYTIGLGYTLIICIVRCFFVLLITGSFTVLAFSLAGGITSIIIMFFLKKYLSIIKVSVSGAITHNIMQTMVAVLITATMQITFYLPLLLIAGAISGFCMGLICNILLKRLNPLLASSGNKH